MLEKVCMKAAIEDFGKVGSNAHNIVSTDYENTHSGKLCVSPGFDEVYTDFVLM